VVREQVRRGLPEHLGAVEDVRDQDGGLVAPGPGLGEKRPHEHLARVLQDVRAVVLVAHARHALDRRIADLAVLPGVAVVQHMAEIPHPQELVLGEGDLDRRRGVLSGAELGALAEVGGEHGLEDGGCDGEDLGGDAQTDDDLLAGCDVTLVSEHEVDVAIGVDVDVPGLGLGLGEIMVRTLQGHGHVSK